jgi:hypothetical protein
MDENRERFLTAIAARLGAERIVELHLFSPLRQGVMETGVAVVAVQPGDARAGVGVGAGDGAGVGEGDGAGDGAGVGEGDEAGVGAGDEAGVGAGDGEGGGAAREADEPSPYLEAAPAEEPVGGDETVAASRHVVFTALYRLTRKGAERGKWFFEVVAQADAPLATVDTVVRGVLHRSKDLTETERLSGDQLRALLAEPAWRTAP